MTCTNKQCPLRYMCEKGQNEDSKGEYFEFKTLKGHDTKGNIRYTNSCDAFEKKKDKQERSDINKKMYDNIVQNIFEEVDEVYGKIEPTEKEVC